MLLFLLLSAGVWSMQPRLLELSEYVSHSCPVQVCEVRESVEVAGTRLWKGVFRIGAPKGFWLPETSFLVWDGGSECWNSPSIVRLQPEWLIRDAEGYVVSEKAFADHGGHVLLGHRLKSVIDSEENVYADWTRKRVPASGVAVPELVIEGEVSAPAGMWKSGKLQGEVRLWVAPQVFLSCEIMPEWGHDFSVPEGKNGGLPMCERIVFANEEEFQAWAGSWIGDPVASGDWQSCFAPGGEDGGFFLTASFLPDYVLKDGDAFFSVTFTHQAADKARVVRNVRLVDAESGKEAALLMGYEVMESSKAGTWSECYYYVMPERAAGPRVVWEEQQAFRVSVPVVLDADVPWRRK